MKRANSDSSSCIAMTPRATAALPVRARRCLLLCLCALVSLARPAASTGADSVLRLSSSEFILSDATEPPPADAAWQSQALPDLWANSRPDSMQRPGWYRFRFDLDRQPAQPYAVFITRIRPVGEVFANRAYVGRSGSIERPQNTVYPQYFNLPPGALRSGPNELFVRMAGTGAHGLTPISVGEDVAVRPEFERRFFWQVTGVQFCSAFALIWGVFSLLLWLRRRNDTLYAYFGLSALCWAIYTSSYLVRFPPLPQPWWEAWVDIGAYGKIMFMTMFALRFAGLDWPRIERGLWCVFALLMGLALVGDLDLIAGIGNIEWWRPVFAFTVVYVGIFAYAAWREPRMENVLVALAASVHLIDGAYQYLLPHPFGNLPLDCYDFLPLNVMLVWILIDRFIRARDEAQKLNAELEHRVAQKHDELEQSFRQVQQMERLQAIAGERQRIMCDMHDGIGGQLISTLSMVEQGESSSTEIAAALRECLDDLRLTIDSLEPTDNDLVAVLANLRYRLDGRLKHCGISLDWKVREVPRLACLTPQNVLHVLRILQEAFTNVLKHANADSVSVETGVDAPGAHAYIRVRDNGTGFHGDRAGHGLANMRERARTIGGKLDVDTSPTGTTLELLLPVT